MVIGHNPGLEGLLQILSGRIEALPTSTIAYLSLPVDSWRDLHEDTESDLLELLIPHQLEEAEEEEKKAKEKEKGKEKGKGKKKGKAKGKK